MILISKTKEMSFCHKLKFSSPFIFAILNSRLLTCPTMSYIRSQSLSLKHKRFKPSSCKDIGIRKFELVTKSQFLLTLES